MLQTHLLTATKLIASCWIKNVFLLKNMKLQQKNEFQNLYLKKDEINGDNFTDENEGRRYC